MQTLHIRRVSNSRLNKSERLNVQIARTTSLSVAASVLVMPSVFGQIDFDWPRTQYETGWGSFVAAEDFDFDGWLDLAVTKQGAAGAEILRNNGDGTFSHYADIGLPGYAMGAFLKGKDVDFDGDPDLIWASSPDSNGYIHVAFNDGYGLDWRTSTIAVGEPLRNLTVGNIDNDGDIDIIAAVESGVAVFEIENDEIQPKRIVHDRSLDDYRPNGLVSGDFDRDGDQDIASVFVNGFPYYYDAYYKVVGSEVVVLWNSGDGEFDDVTRLDLPYNKPLNKRPRQLAVGDLDGDSDLDFVLTVGDPWYWHDVGPAEYRVIRNEGAGQEFVLEEATEFGHGDCRSVAMGDIDTDGHIDVLFTTDGMTALFVLQNLGGGEFAPMVAFPTGNPEAIGIHVRDVTDDGQLDIFVGGQTGISMLENLTSINNPRIDAPPLVRGQLAEIRISGLNPGERATIIMGNRGWKPTLGISYFGNKTFDLAGPFLGNASFRARSDGTAVLPFKVPVGMPLGPAMFQLGARRGPNGSLSVKSPFETAVVVDR